MRTMLNALGARRAALQNDTDRQKGFTLIELLVVVIIIGILAAIAIPVYLGLQNSAKESGVQSDIANAKIGVVAMQTDTGTFPTAGAIDPTTPANAKYGFTKSANTGAITLQGTAAAWCVSAPSTTDPVVTFAASDLVGSSKGKCVSGVWAAP